MLLAACAKAPVSGDLSVVPTGDGAFRIEDTAAAAPLTGDATDLGSVSVAGERVTFRTVSSESRRVADRTDARTPALVLRRVPFDDARERVLPQRLR